MSKVLLGFLAGAAAGAIAGILLAPDSGSNTRKKIASKAGELTDAAKESLGGIVDSVKKVYTGAKEEADQFGEKAKAKVNTATNEVRNALS